MYFIWTGARHNPGGSIVHFALSDLQAGQLGDQAQEISCRGYSGRVYPAECDTTFHVFFLSDQDGDENWDISHTLITPCIVGIEDAIGTSLSIFPNPMTDWLEIRLSEGIQVTDLELRNLNGEVLLHKQVSPTNMVRLEGLQLPKGVYFLQLRGAEGKSYVRKVVVLGTGG